MSEPIDGVTRSGIPYRRGGGSALTGGLTVAWDVLADCPSCGAATGEKCTINWPGRPTKRVTPCQERLPELAVVGDALEPDEEAATVDASAPTAPGEGHRTGTGGPDAPGASEGLDAAIEAAYNAITDADPWFGTDQDHWRHAGLAVRAAEPILRQAVAEEIAQTAEQWAADTIDMRAAPAYQAMADVARIIGKRGAKP